MRFISLTHPPDPLLERMGWKWMLQDEEGPYFSNEMLCLSEAEVEAFAEATETLYEMMIAAGEHIIERELWREAGIPSAMARMIRQSWEDDRWLHLFGRFDLAGGIEGRPIKLLEFNADTPTSLPETAIVQWAQLLANGYDEARQFNSLYEALTANFMTLRTLNPDKEPQLLISTMSGFPEDETNVEVLGEAAKEGGFTVAYSHVEDVEFSAKEGIFLRDKNGYRRFDYWFKLVPWEFIAYDEPELLQLLDQIIEKRLAVVANPPYTLLFQSKYILKVLWDLYPDHPLLLPTYSQQPPEGAYVEKVLFGREGQNVRIFDANGQLVESQAGEYDEFDRIYQAYTELPRDDQGNTYQGGVFFAYEACGLGFRYADRLIIEDNAMFMGHVIE